MGEVQSKCPVWVTKTVVNFKPPETHLKKKSVARGEIVLFCTGSKVGEISTNQRHAVFTLSACSPNTEVTPTCCLFVGLWKYEVTEHTGIFCTCVGVFGHLWWSFGETSHSWITQVWAGGHSVSSNQLLFWTRASSQGCLSLLLINGSLGSLKRNTLSREG